MTSLAAKLVHHFVLMLDRRNIRNRRKSRVPFDTLLQVSETGSSEAVSQDPEVKTDELLQNIRQSEVSLSDTVSIYINSVSVYTLIVLILFYLRTVCSMCELTEHNVPVI